MTSVLRTRFVFFCSTYFLCLLTNVWYLFLVINHFPTKAKGMDEETRPNETPKQRAVSLAFSHIDLLKSSSWKQNQNWGSWRISSSLCSTVLRTSSSATCRTRTTSISSTWVSGTARHWLGRADWLKYRGLRAWLAGGSSLMYMSQKRAKRDELDSLHRDLQDR